jgi:hypothetical protein
MATRRQELTHVFAGGWATDFGQVADVTVGADGQVRIPFLLEAKNVYYELDGAPHKIGGRQKYVPASGDPALESGATVTGIFDYWKMGTSLTGTQRRVAMVGTKLWDLDSDSEILSGFTANAIPNFNTFDDKLIISTTEDVPHSWDQITPQVLAGSPPNFSFSVTHKGRLFAAGDVNNPSKVYYSPFDDPENATGFGWSEFNVNPGDGDVVTGLASFRGELWIFKGPHKGSIHRLEGSSALGVNGSALTLGQDAFKLTPFVEGVGAVAQSTIFRMGNDLAFMWSDGAIHTLQGTAAFGDMLQSTLSQPINNWLREHIVHSRLRFAQAAVDNQRGYALITVTVNAGSENNEILMIDFRRQPVWWAHWPAEDMASLALMNDTENQGLPSVFGGGYDGYTYRLNGNARNVDTDTAISAEAEAPFLNYGLPFTLKEIDSVALNAAPSGGSTMTFGWTRDDQPEQTVSIVQTSSSRLAPATPESEEFELDTSILGGNAGREYFYDLHGGGEFRRVKFRVANAELDRDLELHSIGLKLRPTAESLEN